MANENPVSKDCTISTIDDKVSRLNGRLVGLRENLRSATYGEKPECETKEDNVESIPSSSIESINRRLDDAHDIVDSLERFMQRYHS